jgi:hypothetical protein
MKKKMISFKSFERNINRFKKISNKKMVSYFEDSIEKDILIQEMGEIFEKMLKTYKRSPFKRKTSYDINNYKLPEHKKINTIRIQYLLSEDFLIFKLLTRTKNKYKRNCILTLKLK